jgi:hypothetical protein
MPLIVGFSTGAVPVPERLTVCGLLLALSLTFMVAVRVPIAPGVKVTEILHQDFSARSPPQVFVCVKSLGSAPVNVMLLIVNAVGRLLASMTMSTAPAVSTVRAANVKEVGETIAGKTPVPVSVAVWGVFDALSVTVSVAV